MIIAPLVFATLVVGIAKVGDFKAVGRIGIKTLAYFTFATLIALSLGLILVNFFQPGLVMGMTPESSVVNFNKVIEELLLANHFDPAFVKSVMPKATPIQTVSPTFSEFIKHAFRKALRILWRKKMKFCPLSYSVYFWYCYCSHVVKPGEQVIKFFDAVAHTSC